jgi:hypothetical protein
MTLHFVIISAAESPGQYADNREMTSIRRPVTALLVVLRIATALVLPARADADDDLLAAVMRASGFSGLYEEIALTGSVLTRPVIDVVRLLFDDRVGLAPYERDALVLALLHHADRVAPRIEPTVVFVVLDLLEMVVDWTLIAEMVDRAAVHDFGGRESRDTALMLLSVGDRLLNALEGSVSSRVGHERTARALGRAVEAQAASIAAGPAGIAVVLAETLRSIARLLRDEEGVRALRGASRALLVRPTE